MTVQTRPTYAACPPWCAGHDETYQQWERRHGALQRDHADQGRHVGQVTVFRFQLEALDGPVTWPSVLLGTDSDLSELSPQHARELAALLLEAAAAVEEH